MEEFLSLDTLSLVSPPLLILLAPGAVRYLYFVTQLLDPGHPCVSALEVGTVELGVELAAIPTRRQPSINTQHCQQIM